MGGSRLGKFAYDAGRSESSEEHTEANVPVQLPDVFRRNGIPTYTFVEPIEFPRLLVALQEPGRGIVLEGPSGIGKTTALHSALHQLDRGQPRVLLSGRTDADKVLELISGPFPEGLVIIDDFHRLPEDHQRGVSDILKILADREVGDRKLVLLGINRAGASLIDFSRDLNNRTEIIRFESEPPDRILQLIKQGEEALNISLRNSEDIAALSDGSFYIAQLLAHKACTSADVLEAQPKKRHLPVNIETIRASVQSDLSRTYEKPTVAFARGVRFTPGGRAPYLHVLKWLSQSEDGVVRISDLKVRHSGFRRSLENMAVKGTITRLIGEADGLEAALHYEPTARVLSIEDPQFAFYLRNLGWRAFAERTCGFESASFPSQYDFALSFAGTNRPIAEKLNKLLEDNELSVFYDKNEEDRMLARNLEEYLEPIYQSDAEFVIAIIGPDYPDRVWTQFESKAFEERFGENRVIQMWAPGMKPTDSRRGSIKLTHDYGIDSQLQNTVELLKRKLAEARVQRGAEPVRRTYLAYRLSEIEHILGRMTAFGFEARARRDFAGGWLREPIEIQSKVSREDQLQFEGRPEDCSVSVRWSLQRTSLTDRFVPGTIAILDGAIREINRVNDLIVIMENVRLDETE